MKADTIWLAAAAVGTSEAVTPKDSETEARRDWLTAQRDWRSRPWAARRLRTFSTPQATPYPAEFGPGATRPPYCETDHGEDDATEREYRGVSYVANGSGFADRGKQREDAQHREQPHDCARIVLRVARTSPTHGGDLRHCPFESDMA